jgi:FdrA protein
VIVLISKPAAPDVAQRVLEAAARTGKRVVACLLGQEPLTLTLSPKGEREPIQFARNLYHAARLAASAHAKWAGMAADELPRPRLAAGQDRVLGLYCGGTLCQEAAGVLADPRHRFIDFGDDRYTRGRAHPMIDPTLRNQAILDAGGDPSVAILLLDVILGYGAHADPASVLVPVIEQTIAHAAADGRVLAVFGHVVGTDWDAQDLAHQQARLRAAGMRVFGSNYHAAVAASLVIEAAGPC